MSNFNFEQQINTLESLVATMEQNDLSLENSMLNFEKGIKLVKECQQALNQAEQKITLLQNNNLEKFQGNSD